MGAISLAIIGSFLLTKKLLECLNAIEQEKLIYDYATKSVFRFLPSYEWQAIASEFATRLTA